MKFSLKKEDKKYQDTNLEDLVFENSITTEIVQEIKHEEFNPWDYVRVVNVRGYPEHQATPDEKVIVAHRGNPILGNKHPMKVQTMRERDRVISEYKKDLDADLAIKGPMYQSLQNIAKDVVENKQKIAFSCFCFPHDCHAQKLLPVVVEMSQEIINKKNQNTKKMKP